MHDALDTFFACCICCLGGFLLGFLIASVNHSAEARKRMHSVCDAYTKALEAPSSHDEVLVARTRCEFARNISNGGQD
jgi:hypothetical protein